MALQFTAIDAVIGGIATAFFGGLLASGAYLLKQQLALREQVLTLSRKLETLRSIEPAVEAAAIARLRSGERKTKESRGPGGNG